MKAGRIMLARSSTLPALDATIDKLALSPNPSGQVEAALLLKHGTSPTPVAAQHGLVRIQGCLHARVLATEREAWSVVSQELREDIAASLRTRLQLLCDELEEEELGTERRGLLGSTVAGTVEWQLPQRVTAPLVPGLAAGDYMVPGEGRDECAERFAELLSSQVEEDTIEAVEGFLGEQHPDRVPREQNASKVAGGAPGTVGDGGNGTSTTQRGGGLPMGVIIGAIGAAAAGVAAFMAAQQ